MLPSRYDGLLQGLRLGFLRFPGGDWGEEHDLQPQHFAYLYHLMEATQAEGLVHVRLRGGHPEQAGHWVRWNHENSRPIRFWSIGNEPDRFFDDAQAFSRTWRTFALVMKDADPNILLVGPDISFWDPTHGPFDRNGRPWLDTFLEINGDLVDLVSVHRYPFPEVQGGPATKEALLEESPQWSDFFRTLQAHVRRILGRDKPIAVTEFNSHWSKHVYGAATPDSYANALWWAEVMLQAARENVAMMGYFALYSPDSYGGWGIFGDKGVRPTYYAFWLAGRLGPEQVPILHALPSTVAVLVTHDPATATLAALFVHRGDAPQPVHLLVPGRALTQAEGFFLTGPEATLNRQDLPAANPMEFTLPPYSVVLVRAPMVAP